ncbi:hypothetical protein E2L07_02295 [Halalkalibacterium halodurans]|uniref:YusW family protein n=1 Tax=Halalkalibacterium halodurans TaxID=86665 RepID=UPI001068758A|nr:YusW family protein [Halalkalibacterium halodurans]TES57532.1 hypothetical protein E2L07_02295 [Halalkalibacterium halodurans]
MKRHYLFSICILTLLLLAACGSSATEDHELEVPEDHETIEIDGEEEDSSQPVFSDEEALVVDDLLEEESRGEEATEHSEPIEEDTSTPSEASGSENVEETEQRPADENNQAFALNVKKFKLELEWQDGDELEMEYEQKKNEKGKAKVEWDGAHKEKMSGKQAVEWMEDFLSQLDLSEGTNSDRLKSQVYAILDIDPSEVEELDLEIEFFD